MNQDYLMEVQYCLAEAYKIAVRELAITDWSREDKDTRYKVAELQVEIAKMIQNAITRKV